MMEPTPPPTPTPPTSTSMAVSALIADFRVLLMLFVGLRLMLLMAYAPVGIHDIDGLTEGGDRIYHYSLVRLTDSGDLPFRDWWSEFPPVWYGLGVIVYKLLLNANFPVWTAAMSIVMLLFDAGNLWLVRAIGSRTYGRATGTALAWMYALLAIPLVQLYWSFESLVTFFLLLGVLALIQRRDAASAAAAAAGALVKFTPALLLGVALRYRRLPRAVLYVLIAASLFAAAYGALLIDNPNPEVALTSLTAQFRKASYGSIWALIDGNFSLGEFAAPREDRVLIHFDLAAADRLYGKPALVPGWVRLMIGLSVGLVAFVRTRRFDNRGLLAFTLLTLMVFFIQAQGWSPDWLVQVLPLILLCYPTRAGVLTCLTLGALSLLEYPVLYTRIITPSDLAVDFGLLATYALSIITRTGIMVGLCVALYRMLRVER